MGLTMNKQESNVEYNESVIVQKGATDASKCDFTNNIINSKSKIPSRIYTNNEVSSVSYHEPRHRPQEAKYVQVDQQTVPNVGVKVHGETRHIHINNKHANQEFATNYIRTTKYTLYNFLFLALAYQYLRFSNCYFLLVMILSCTEVSPVSPVTAINPVVFVLCVSLLREAIEDYGRYKQDKEQNL
jgi:hypothetical protein